VAAAWQLIEAKHFATIQKQVLASFELSTISSSLEMRRLRERHPEASIRVVKNAVPFPARVPPLSGEKPLVTFVGNLNYAPNLDAALWLCRAIWPSIRGSGRRGAQLRIVGRNPPAQLVREAAFAGVGLEPRLEDLASLYRRSTIVVAPLRAGGGTRIKIVEAAAHRVPVVSTWIGAEGLELRAGHHLWLSESAAGLARSCSDALDNRIGRDARAEAAYRVVRREHEWGAVRARLTGILAPLLT
jgi:glycosyltransferase involved in cell wall biosynthesis